MFWLAIILLNVLNVADAVLTYDALRLGVEETSWLPMRWMIDRMEMWAFWKLSTVWLWSVVVLIFAEPHRWARLSVYGLVLFYGAVVVYSLVWIHRLGGLL